MPAEGQNKLTFQNWKNTQRLPFVIYADFECLLQPVENANRKQGKHGKTNREREHVPIAVALQLVSTRPSFQMPYEVIVQENANDPVPLAEKFLKRLLVIEKAILAQLANSECLVMTEEDNAKHDATEICYICKQPFKAEIATVELRWQKVRDHDHFTGKYRGAAHSGCNLQLRRQLTIPVFLHNFRGYDSHLIVAAMGKVKDKDHKISVVGQGLERYLQVRWGTHIVFRDTLQFLDASLATLVEALRGQQGGLQHFKQLAKGFVHGSKESIEKLLRKGVFPYDWFDKTDKLRQASLPSQEEFYNLLTQMPVSDSEYTFAKDIWVEHKCQTFSDYLQL